MIKSALQSSLTNDIKYRSMSAGAVPSSEYLITSTVLTGSASSVSFDVSAFNGVYKHLTIVASIARASTGDTANGFIQLNGTNMTAAHALYGTGSSVISFQYSSSRAFNFGGTGDQFTSMVLEILDPYSTAKNKTVRTFGGTSSAEPFIHLVSGFVNSTAAVSTISLSTDASFQAKSRFSIYGVTA